MVKLKFREDASVEHAIKDGEDIIFSLSGTASEPSKAHHLDY